MVYGESGEERGCAVGGLEGRLGMDGVKVTCYFPSPALPPLDLPSLTPSLAGNSAHTPTSLSSSSKFKGMIPSVTKEVAWS